MAKKKSPTIGKLFYYRSELVQRATPMEQAFIRRLTGGRFRFKFQFLIPPYIVDFVIPKRMLVIELDGQHHNLPEQRRYDERRTRYLERHGFAVVRIPNSEVLTWPLKRIRKYPKCSGAFHKVTEELTEQFAKHGIQPPPKRYLEVGPRFELLTQNVPD